MPLHRLTAVTYLGGLPSTHDLLNDPAANGDVGAPANADAGKKLVGPNAGTYFIAFGEDGTSEGGNRPHFALGESVDFLDDVVSGELPVPENLDAVAAGAVAAFTMTGDVFVGKSGAANTQDERDRLISVVESATNNEIIDATGLKVTCSAILDAPAGSNVVGVPASGFQTGPTLEFTPPIPTGVSYRIIFARRGSLVTVVPSKVHLDALTRLSIRSAHEVPAETQRFMREAGRRVGGSVAAVVANIFETPGLGENILGVSNTMFMDVDPDASVGTGGSWSVRFDRDVTPKVMFRVNEGTGGDSSCENAFERLAFRDVNSVAVGFSEDTIPLTSGVAVDGDSMVRLGGADPGVPFSIIKRLNAEPFVTCGDGSSSFGDFNGSSAIADAVAFLSGLGRNIHILVKPGSYNCSNVDLTTTGTENSVVIEGVGTGLAAGGGVHITNNAIAGATSAAFESTSAFGSNITFRNITFFRGGTSDLAFYTLDCKVEFESCNFRDQSIRHDVGRDLATTSIFSQLGPNVLHLKNCKFNIVSITTPPLHYRITVTSGNPHARGYVAEDCIFDLSSTSDTPVCRVENGDIGVAGTLEGVFFNRCVLNLGATTNDGGGNLNGNSGALEIVPGTTSNLSVTGSVEWRDCRVSVVGAAVGKILLYLRIDDGSGAVDFSSAAVKIRGGRWSVVGSTSIFAPFFIGGSTVSVDGPNRVVVEDLDWGFDTGGGDYGAPTTEISAASTAGHAAFWVRSFEVFMHNVTWLSATTLSSMGDLHIESARKMRVKGLTMDSWTNAGAGTTPSSRMEFVGQTLPQFHGCVIEDIFIGANESTDDAADIAIVLLQPNAHTSAVVVDRPMTVRGCRISGFTGGGPAGFSVRGNPNGNHNGLHMIDCSALEIAGPGFFFDATGGTDETIKDHKHVNCVYESCGWGVYYNNSAGPNLGDVLIQGCLLRENTNQGVFMDTSWGSSFGLILSGNHFDNNDSGGTVRQVTLSNGTTAVGCAYGNSAAGGATPQLFNQVGGPSDLFRGSETGYSYDPTSGAVANIVNAVTTVLGAANSRQHQSLVLMMHNHMRWSP